MEWVGGAGLVMMLLVWLFLCIVEREPKTAGGAKIGATGEADKRRESHNEWLKAWYNALPVVEKSKVLNDFELWTQGYGREHLDETMVKQQWVLSSVQKMVDGVANPSVAKFAKAEAASKLAVGNVRADGLRVTSVLDGGPAVDCQSARGVERRKGYARAMADKCTTCGCGPADAC
jgi:hypothetical protein